MTAASVNDYYDAIELALAGLEEHFGEFRRHLGISPVAPPDGYCWFKGATAPDRHPEFTAWGCDAVERLHGRFFSDLSRLEPGSVLDAGCGNGGTLQHLAADGVTASLVGVNAQPRQVATARRILRGTGAEIVQADFLEHAFERRFDLIVMVESAFHMPDKRRLVRRVRDLLTVGGELWLLDIVVAERAASAFEALGGIGSLFHFATRSEWLRVGTDAGMVELEYSDLSRPASVYLQVSDVETLRCDYFAPRMAGHPHAEALTATMVEVAVQYRRLSRLFRSGMLEYALMRYRKAQG